VSLLTKSKTSPSFLSGLTRTLSGAASGLFDTALSSGIGLLASKIGGTAGGGTKAKSTQAMGALPAIIPRVLPALIPGAGGSLAKLIPGIIGGGIGGAIVDVIGGAGAAGVACPSGFHPAKDGSGRCVRNRRMNSLNPRAFRRAVRRLKGARRFAKEVEKVFPRPRRAAPAKRHLTGPQHT